MTAAPFPIAPLHPQLVEVIARMRQRSQDTRADYLRRMHLAHTAGVARGRLGCANLAHGFAAAGGDKEALRRLRWPNIAIVSAYNDMLSAHQPLERFPALIKMAAREAGAVAQFAGGVPAMCDGITQGLPGMELSLFSRDVIAMATGRRAGARHVRCGTVPGRLRQDRARTADRCAVLRSPAGHIRTRRTHALRSGQSGKGAHAPAACAGQGRPQRTAGIGGQQLSCSGHLHLLRHRQQQSDADGGHGAAPAGQCLRAAQYAIARCLDARGRRARGAITALGQHYLPLCEIVDERAIVNAIVGLLATGGSTNHTMHLVAIARAAGIVINWDDFSELSRIVPLLARIYPNGSADINHFHAAGGMGFLIRELLSAGLLHADAHTVMGGGLAAYAQEPLLIDGALQWRAARVHSTNLEVLRPAADPFSADGGLKLLCGNLGRAVIKTSALADQHRVVEAPALVFDSQQDVIAAFNTGQLERDVVVVVRFQGPRANGMPELHALTPALAVLQKRGFRVALVTDGRMSGASGTVPAAIHVTPECLNGGALARVHDGDLIRLDSIEGILEAKVPTALWQQREPATPELTGNAFGLGRELFGGFRASAGDAECGALSVHA